MEEITFSIFNHNDAALKNMEVLLQKFEQRFGIRVHIDKVPSSAARWSKLVETALYHNGPDISEVGNTWVGDLVRMEAVRPFKPDEVTEIVGERHFFDAVWNSNLVMDHGSPIVYSIPLLADVRVLFYRRDLLAKAGIEETNAFNDFGQLEKTLNSLKVRGIPMPWVFSTRRTSMTLHLAASWVWNNGGDFLSPDGTKLAFDQAQAMNGFKSYFRMARHLSPEARNLEESEADAMFDTGKAAVFPSGYWNISNELAAEVRQNLGVAPMPGVPFVGGSNLVIWNHSRHPLAAMKLIKFLHTQEAAMLLYPWFGLPISEDRWSISPFNFGLYPILKEAIMKGRGFPSVRLWGLVEKRLTDTMTEIWAEVLKETESHSDEIVEAQLKGLAQRLQLTLEL
jgi:multiple sugar transport system substrate-binding protein